VVAPLTIRPGRKATHTLQQPWRRACRCSNLEPADAYGPSPQEYLLGCQAEQAAGDAQARLLHRQNDQKLPGRAKHLQTASLQKPMCGVNLRIWEFLI
jgi:hypothetical protein